MVRVRKAWVLSTAVLLLAGGCYKGEADRLRKQVAAIQRENEELKKKIELLSGTVKQLADLQALNQSAEQKRQEEETKNPEKK